MGNLGIMPCGHGDDPPDSGIPTGPRTNRGLGPGGTRRGHWQGRDEPTMSPACCLVASSRDVKRGVLRRGRQGRSPSVAQQPPCRHGDTRSSGGCRPPWKSAAHFWNCSYSAIASSDIATALRLSRPISEVTCRVVYACTILAKIYSDSHGLCKDKMKSRFSIYYIHYIIIY